MTPSPTPEGTLSAREIVETLDKHGWIGHDPHGAEVFAAILPIIESIRESERRAERERCAKAVCSSCERGVERADGEHFYVCESPATCPGSHDVRDGKQGYFLSCSAEDILREQPAVGDGKGE